MATKKCLLIDATNRAITETTFNTIADLNELVGGYIEIAHSWLNGDTLYVDEEGLLKQPTAFFRIPQRPDQAFGSNGVLVGREEEGRQHEHGFTNLDPVMTAAGLRAIVRWVVA